MRKFVKVIEIILIVLAVLCGVALLVGYIWFKDNTIEIINNIKDFVNQPLPIIGVSIVGVGLFLYEIIVRLQYGKRALNNVKVEYENKLHALEDKETKIKEIADEVSCKLNDQDLDIEALKGYIVELCNFSRNIKAHELGELIERGNDNGEETKNSQAIEE